MTISSHFHLGFLVVVDVYSFICHCVRPIWYSNRLRCFPFVLSCYLVLALSDTPQYSVTDTHNELRFLSLAIIFCIVISFPEFFLLFICIVFQLGRPHLIYRTVKCTHTHIHRAIVLLTYMSRTPPISINVCKYSSSDQLSWTRSSLCLYACMNCVVKELRSMFVVAYSPLRDSLVTHDWGLWCVCVWFLNAMTGFNLGYFICWLF